MNAQADLIDQLSNIAGPANVLSDGDLTAWEQDWRKRYRGKAMAVVRPGNTWEVAQVVRACAAAGTSIVPQGGNTGLVGGGVPDHSGRQIVLSLSRMQSVRRVDPDNLTITVEAGCLLQSVQEVARDAGLMFPLSLAAEGSCTIGGNLATNAGGTQVLQFGNARDLCLGLEVVTAQGEIWDGLSGLRKDNTGYDLRDLFIGSEGTLGIITAATLKLFPQPGAVMTAMASCSSLEGAVSLLNLARKRLGAQLTGFEVMSRASTDLVERHFPQLKLPMAHTADWSVLFEMSADDETRGQTKLEELMEQALDQELVTDAVVAANLAQAHRLWHLRESIPLAQAEEGLNIKHDIALPVSAIAEFVERTTAELEAQQPGIRMIVFGHLGDGNLHFNVQAPSEQSPSAFLSANEAMINRVVYDNVTRMSGSISAEHGIGQLKRQELARYKSAVAIQLMGKLKDAFDPQGTLNPGRIIPP